MKTTIRHLSAAMIISVMAVSGLSSCIFDGAGDKFYRTLWISDDVPLGPFQVDSMSLEFLCGQATVIEAFDTLGGRSRTAIHGTYDHDKETAVFHNLAFTIQDRTITFIDATHSGETLFLRWRIEDSVYPFTTAMHRPDGQK